MLIRNQQVVRTINQKAATKSKGPKENSFGPSLYYPPILLEVFFRKFSDLARFAGGGCATTNSQCPANHQVGQ